MTTVDAIGLRCPLPVLRLARALRDLPQGACVELLADDGMAWIDVPHFCAEAGHQLSKAEEHDTGYRFIVVRGPLQDPRAC